MVNVNEQMIVDALKMQYSLQINEVLKLLSKDLNVQNKEQFRDFPKGTVFSIDSINVDGVILQHQIYNDEIQPDQYNATKYSVSYDDIEKYFDLA